MAKQSLSTLSQCAYSLQYRLVLVTKYRRKVISPAIMKRLREIFEDTPVFWHHSYCVLTCGGAPLEVIKRYIENQGKDAPSGYVARCENSSPPKPPKIAAMDGVFFSQREIKTFDLTDLNTDRVLRYQFLLIE